MRAIDLYPFCLALCSTVVGCQAAASPVVEMEPGVETPTAIPTPAECEPLPTTLGWRYLYGGWIAVPPLWEAPFETNFSIAGEDRHFTFDANNSFDPVPYLEDARKVIGAYFGGKVALSPVTSLQTPAGVAHYVLPLGEFPDRMMALGALERQPRPVSIKLMGLTHELQRFPTMLASLQPLDSDAPLPKGRYRVSDVSFAWDGPLELPHYFSFHGEGERRLIIEWVASPTPFAETEWSTKFSFSSEPGAPLEETRRISSGRFCTEEGRAVASPSFATLKRTLEVENYDGERRFLVHIQAQADFGARTLLLEYYDDRQSLNEPEEFVEFVSSIVPESG
jgi:hypothetical protein